MRYEVHITRTRKASIVLPVEADSLSLAKVKALTQAKYLQTSAYDTEDTIEEIYETVPSKLNDKSNAHTK
jgi:hypothetical protein